MEIKSLEIKFVDRCEHLMNHQLDQCFKCKRDVFSIHRSTDDRKLLHDIFEYLRMNNDKFDILSINFSLKNDASNEPLLIKD